MPEFIIKTRPNGEKYEENDIIGVANRRHIRCEHASRLCSRYAPEHRNADGFIALGSLAEKWYQRTRQYRFERVSRDEIKRINQWTGTEIVYGSTPVEDPDRPGKMIHCNVDAFFKRRLRNGKHVVCGSPGSEVYYEGDGKQDTSHARLDLVWNDITNETGLRDDDFPHLNLSTLTLKRHLVLPVDDFDDAMASELVSPWVETADTTVLDVTLVEKGTWDVVVDALAFSEPDRIIDADGETFRVVETLLDLTFRVSGPKKPVTGPGVIEKERAKRKYQVDWRVLFPVDIPPETTENDVLDVRKRIDVRHRSGSPFQRENIVLTKTE